MEIFKNIFLFLGIVLVLVYYIIFFIGFLFNTIPYEHSMLNLIVALLLTIIIKMDLKDNK